MAHLLPDDVRILITETLDNLPTFVIEGIDQEGLAREMSWTVETVEKAALPRIYQIETTARCNLSCPFCPRTTQIIAKGQRDMNTEMPYEKFVDVLDRMPWLKSIELFHFGEPFMQKDLHEYVKACKERGIYTVIASNLNPATPKAIDRVFDAGLDFLVMDVDSLDPERYTRMRVKGTLERMKKAVTYILSKPRSERPYCVAQTIMLDGTPEYTEAQFKEWSGGLMPEEIRYKFLDSFRSTVLPKGILGEKDLCREPFYGFTVHVNGDVVPCDRDWGGENVMGNVFEQGIMDIWNGEKFEEFRRQMKSPEKPAMCRKCDEGRLVNLRSQPHIQVNMFKGNEVFHK